ncbi:MAG: hypothetical protein QXJ38_03345 [Thermofilaceae archaeon]
MRIHLVALAFLPLLVAPSSALLAALSPSYASEPAASPLAQAMKVYLLYVQEAGDSWVSKDLFASYISTHLKSLGVGFEVVKSIDDWERLVDQAPENIVVVNCHGEVMPIPTKYGDNYTAFYLDLARNLREKGWVLVVPIGLTTWLIGNEKTVGYTNTVDGPSVSAFRRAVGLPPINPWCDATASVSDLGRKVMAVTMPSLGMAVPETIGAARAFATNATPAWFFYKVPEDVKSWDGLPFYAMAAWKVGKGLLVWGGLSGGEEAKKAAITASVVAYILDPTIVERPPPPPPLFTPETVYMAVIAIAILILLGVLGVILIKARAKPAQPPAKPG